MTVTSANSPANPAQPSPARTHRDGVSAAHIHSWSRKATEHVDADAQLNSAIPQ
jgi:hypothetical protein